MLDSALSCVFPTKVLLTGVNEAACHVLIRKNGGLRPMRLTAQDLWGAQERDV